MNVYSDGKIHEVGWFEDVIEPVAIRADQYDQEFAKGLYEFAQPEILSGTEIITVRYKTPEGILLWLDNIPVMRDGYGVTGVINWYLATNQEEVTTDNAGWTASLQDINANKKYLWNYEAVKYTSNKLVKTTPRIIARWTSGRAIKDITEYYLISDQQTGVTSADSGWSKELLSFNQDKPYLWNYERVEYSTGETATTSPRVLGFYGQGVQGDKGDKGDKGDRGDKGDKGGQYWGRNKPASPVKGDTYLDVQRMYLMEYNGTTWTTVPYTDTRYTVAVQDIIGSATDSGQLMQIANAWVANLVAGTVLANQLMAKTLVVQDGGSIQSQNYSQGVRGWKINSNGFAEFENGVFRGQVNATSGTFQGAIYATSGTFAGSMTTNGVTLTPGLYLSIYKEPNAPLYIYNHSQNVAKFQHWGTGKFLLMLDNQVAIRTFTAYWGDGQIHHFGACVVTGNASNRDYTHQYIVSSEFNSVPLDLHTARPFIDTNNRIAYITHILITVTDNNTDQFLDPESLSTFVFFNNVVL